MKKLLFLLSLICAISYTANAQRIFTGVDLYNSVESGETSAETLYGFGLGWNTETTNHAIDMRTRFREEAQFRVDVTYYYKPLVEFVPHSPVLFKVGVGASYDTIEEFSGIPFVFASEFYVKRGVKLSSQMLRVLDWDNYELSRFMANINISFDIN